MNTNSPKRVRSINSFHNTTVTDTNAIQSRKLVHEVYSASAISCLTDSFYSTFV